MRTFYLATSAEYAADGESGNAESLERSKRMGYLD